MSNQLKDLLKTEVTTTETSELLTTINKFKDAIPESADFKLGKSEFSAKTKDLVLTFAGNITKQYEQVSQPLAYAFTEVMAFHSNNSLARLWYSVLDPVNKMGNATMAKAIQNLSYEVFGVSLIIKAADKLKPGESPFVGKNRKEDLEKGIKAPKDMDQKAMLKCIELLEANQFKELLTAFTADKVEEDKTAPPKPENELSLTKDQKANLNCKKAMQIAKTVFRAQQAAKEGISDIRIKRLSLALDELMIQAGKIELDILGEKAVTKAASDLDENATSDQVVNS